MKWCQLPDPTRSLYGSSISVPWKYLAAATNASSLSALSYTCNRISCQEDPASSMQGLKNVDILCCRRGIVGRCRGPVSMGDFISTTDCGICLWGCFYTVTRTRTRELQFIPYQSRQRTAAFMFSCHRSAEKSTCIKQIPTWRGTGSMSLPTPTIGSEIISAAGSTIHIFQMRI